MSIQYLILEQGTKDMLSRVIYCGEDVMKIPDQLGNWALKNYVRLRFPNSVVKLTELATTRHGYLMATSRNHNLILFKLVSES